MADIFDAKTRSRVMSRVRSRGNLSTEKRFAKILRRRRIVGWRTGYPLVGHPDFVFPAARVAVFVDGCFWHGCPAHGQIPAANRRFWKNKIDRNIARDLRTTRKLRRLGWHVFRVWEHDLGKPLLNRKLGRLRRIVVAGCAGGG